jgi:hypothetical protein
MQNFFIKPGVDASGAPLFVRDPQSGKPLASVGEWKPKDSFWLHRVRDKDVIETSPAAQPMKASAPKPPAPKSQPALAD